MSLQAHNELMRSIASLALVAAFASAQTAQTHPSFAGRWRLADPATASATVAHEVLVTENDTSATISIERRFASGARFVRYSIGGGGNTAGIILNATKRPGKAVRNVATWLGAALLITTGATASSATTGAVAEHEESWSIGADDTLYIDPSDRVLGGAPRTSHVSYRRVPVPASVPPGQNLLDNADADQGAAFWYAIGDAKLEPCDGNPCFVVRDHGSFRQTALLPKDAAGRYAVLVGSGATERINPDGAITGLPYLYATVGNADGTRVVAHFQGQRLLGRPTSQDAWFKMSGVFLLPEGSARLSFQLSQAERRGLPQNGSAARFDELGLYVFPSEPDAQAFVDAWRGRGSN